MANCLKFIAKEVVATPAAMEAFEKAKEAYGMYLTRHYSGDWGEIDADDAKYNDEHFDDQTCSLHSVFTLHDRTTIWIITEADKSVTTIIMPSEY